MEEIKVNWIYIVLIIIVVGIVVFFKDKVFSIFKKKKKPVKKPLPKPEPPKEETTPDPVQEPKPEPKVFKIHIPNDGKDHTKTIQEQIDAVPDGTEELPNIIEFPEHRIWTEGDNKRRGIIWLNNRKHLIIKGGHFYTKAPAVPYEARINFNEQSERRHFLITNSYNIFVEGTKIEGSDTIPGRLIGTTPELTPAFWKGGFDDGAFGQAPAYRAGWEAEHAFAAENSSYITFKNVYVNGVWGDGICIGGYPNPGSDHVKVIGGEIHNTGRQQIAIYNSEYVLIDGVVTRKGRRAAVDLENYSGDGVIQNVEIRDCDMQTMMTFIAALGDGDVSDIYIHDNKFATTGNALICYDSENKVRRKNWRYENNERLWPFGSDMGDIFFKDTENIIVKGNTNPISEAQSKISATFLNCENVELKDNDFGDGVYVGSQGSKNIKSEGNTPKQEIK